MTRNWRRLVPLGTRTTTRDIQDELDFHLETLIERHIENGLPPSEARRRALEEFGDGAAAAEAMREIDRGHERRRRVSETLGAFAHDVRLALRSLRLNPSFAFTSLATLTLGIAATTAVFTLLYTLFLRPLPFTNPDRLAYINTKAPKWNLTHVGINYPDFDTWQKNVRTFEAMAMIEDGSFNLADETRSERVDGASITRDFPAALGVKILAGRTFTAEEDRPNGPNVVMISRSVWQDRFNNAPGAIGSTLRVHGDVSTIVGVLDDKGLWVDRARIYVPMRGDPAQPWQSYSGDGVGRLKPGVSLAQAEADLRQAHEGIWATKDTARVVTPTVRPFRAEITRGYTAMGGVLAGAAALMLAIAVANAASVILARGVTRQREFGVRAALGASRRRIAMQLFVEIGVLTTIAGAAGLLAGQWLLRGLVGMAGDRLPSWAQFAMRPETILFAVGVVGLASVLAALAPMIAGWRSDARAAIGAGSLRSSATIGQRRMLDALVVVEVTLGVVVLATGALLARGYRSLQDLQPGFRVDSTVAFSIALPQATYRLSPSVDAFVSRVVSEIGQLPGVKNAAAVSCRPLGCHQGNFSEVEGRPAVAGESTPVNLSIWAMPSYFETLGVRITRGRAFTLDDSAPNKGNHVVVSEDYVKWAWPDGTDPVGRRIRPAGARDDEPWWTVVGVARNVRHYGLQEETRPTVYHPFAMAMRDSLPARHSWSIVMHLGSPDLDIMPSVRSIVARMDPTIPVHSIVTMRSALMDSLALTRSLAVVLAVFASIAVLLALGGLFGVLSYAVSRRRREFGIKLALGASPLRVLQSVVWRGVGLIALGSIVAVPAAVALIRVAAGELKIPGDNAGVLVAIVTATMLLAGAGAALLPARRASRVPVRQVLVEE